MKEDNSVDKNVFIFPKDSGFNNKEKLNKAIQDIKSEGIKIVIGPIEHEDFKDVKKYNDLIFISPSNIDPNFDENIISIGVSLESQLTALINFIEKQKKKKTVIMYPKNQYSEFIENCQIIVSSRLSKLKIRVHLVFAEREVRICFCDKPFEI